MTAHGEDRVTAESGETFVVRPGRLRLVLVSTGLVLCAALMLAWAAAACFAANFIDRAAAWIGLIPAALFCVLIAIYLLLSLNAMAFRIELGRERVKLRLPHLRGHLPLPGLIRAELPYDAIASVQYRIEVFGGAGRRQHAFSLVTRDGDRFALGFIIEGAPFQYPLGRTAALIAERAGCPVITRGAVRIGGLLHAMLHGAPDWNAS
jgi:hypothetical protein